MEDVVLGKYVLLTVDDRPVFLEFLNPEEMKWNLIFEKLIEI